MKNVTSLFLYLRTVIKPFDTCYGLVSGPGRAARSLPTTGREGPQRRPRGPKAKKPALRTCAAETPASEAVQTNGKHLLRSKVRSSYSISLFGILSVIFLSVWYVSPLQPWIDATVRHPCAGFAYPPSADPSQPPRPGKAKQNSLLCPAKDPPKVRTLAYRLVNVRSASAFSSPPTGRST